mmetsp:Transcript_311/g.768  ORF Transcript_311/g.768 Transcript_311/m.768 type:complete len:89 (+) Transcript_311:46-312(+)
MPINILLDATSSFKTHKCNSKSEKICNLILSILSTKQIPHQLLCNIPKLIIFFSRKVFNRLLRNIPELIVILPRVLQNTRLGTLGKLH